MSFLTLVSTTLLLPFAILAFAVDDAKSVEYQREWITDLPKDPSEAWAIAYGGRLHDQWAEAQDKLLPEGTHPNYPVSGQIKGSLTWRGKAVFQNLCAICHGFDGRAQNVGSAASPAYVSTIANRNPWEMLHKVRNGFPGRPMPSNIWWDNKCLADVAAYAQTLP